MEYLSNLRFTQSDLRLSAGAKVASAKIPDYLAHFEFACDVWCVEEGMPIFPGEPIGGGVLWPRPNSLRPCCCFHQPSKPDRHQGQPYGGRCREGRTVLEFGSRRAQGADGAVLGARAALLSAVVQAPV